MIVNQWVPAAHKGDAIGDTARRVRDLLREHGPRVRDLRADDRRRPARRRAAVRRSGGAARRRHDLPLRAAVADDRGVRRAAARARAAVPQHHAGALLRAATTPASSGWRRSAAQDLATLVGHTDLALGDSEYNRQELETLGFAQHRRLPDRGRHRPHHRARRAGRPSRRCCDDGLAQLPVRRPHRARTRRSRTTSGWPSTTSATSTRTTASSSSAGPTRVPRYYDTIRALMARVPDAAGPVHLHRAGARRGPRRLLPARRASTSRCREHEGFCVPLLEAMAADVPVLAYASTAVPDTLGGAGVQFAPKDLEFAAELLGELAYDDTLRAPGHRRPAARGSRDFGDASHRARLSSDDRLHGAIVKIAFIVQRYGAEILGGSEYHCRLIAERLAAQARGRGADDLRARLHHLEERVPGGHRPDPRRHRPALRQRRGPATSRRSTSISDWIFHNPHTRDDEMAWLEQQGPWCPALARVPAAAPPAVRRADLLHLPLRADRARPGDRSRRAASWCRRRTTSRRFTSASTSEMFQQAAAVAFNTEVEKNFLKTTFEIRAAAEETVGCGVDLLQDRGRSRDDPEPRGRGGDSQARCRRTCAARGAPVPAPAPAAGPVPALRRPHRRRQGLRGADRVLHQLQGAGRRRHAGADGRQADAAARGAVGALRRACCRSASACRRSKPRPSSSCRRRSRACRCWRSRRWRSARRCCATRAREVLVDHCCKSNAGLFYADRDEFVECAKLLLADERLRERMGRNGKEYVKRNYRWDVIMAKYDRLIGALRPR